MDKQFAVLGLGSFGSSVALTLENMGCDVLVVDESYEKVQEISDKVSYAVKADVSEPDALQALGGRNLDGVVVAISESLEASIMATMLCKEMGIPLVVAKAKDKLQGAILQRVGADRIVYPEIEMGSRVAKSLVSKEFVDWISLSNDYSMVEIVVPQNWVGKSLVDLGVRERLGINVVGIIKNGKIEVAINPQEPLREKEILIVIGSNDTKTPQGILAVVRRMEYTAEDILGETPHVLVLENIQDPGNLGTIFRTAEAAGATGIVLSKDCVDLYNPKVIRSTMGAIFRIPFIYTDDLKGTIDELKREGITVYAAHLKGENSYDMEDYKTACAFLIGHEGNGLTEETAACADRKILIPMEGGAESLNAAVASAVLMFEAGRQRRNKRK